MFDETNCHAKLSLLKELLKKIHSYIYDSILFTVQKTLWHAETKSPNGRTNSNQKDIATRPVHMMTCAHLSGSHSLPSSGHYTSSIVADHVIDINKACCHTVMPYKLCSP